MIATSGAPAVGVSVSTDLVKAGVRLCSDGRVVDLHPQWLRSRSTELGQIEPTNRQRLFTPVDIAADLSAVSCVVNDGVLTVAFSDGHLAHLDLDEILRALGWSLDPEEPPRPEPWSGPPAEFPYVSWGNLDLDVAGADDAALIELLGAFFRHGYVVVRDTPQVAGTVARVAERLGYIVGQNFGWVFDVQSVPSPTDLAYTSIELLAHTDQPYRRPVPGIQLLHCIWNEAPGGDSTLVDGLAAAEELEREHPDLYAALVDTEVEWRYDMGTDTVVARGHVVEVDRRGRFVQIRHNAKLDEPIVRVGCDLDRFYAARRWLTEWTNDPAHQVAFRLRPGDVMIMDNHRALHGRTAFDPTRGRRWLQGCYIEHDGLDTRYRLAVRRQRSVSGP
ncbi:TauD/TfdA family dioxygenase [Ilumatobacter nonamiensis]|uniref:TauD/TfdA family dioxygenase n=1 Tax=Ilumatobacter nonamiensis TaxID=467093 RepID=UPI00130EF95C|nr:TauD/TfdA family dioxygenase [Ilumatobacter nonamiensis]